MAVETRPSFLEQLQHQWNQGKFVCVGLDADLDKLPPHLKKPNGYERPRLFAQFRFLEALVDATHDLVCAYKPNIAFFEDHPEGEEALAYTVDHIHSRYPEIPVIGDVKRADIGNTNTGYAKLFKRYGFDAMTTNPYFGGDTFAPFQAFEGKGLVVLCRTTNPGSKELQDMPIDYKIALDQQLLTREEHDELDALKDDLRSARTIKLYELVAFLAARRWNTNGQLGLVVGATTPEAFAPVRRLAPNIPFLIPGIGTQGGDLEKTLQYAPDSHHQGIIVNSASAIIFASSGEDFAEVARVKTIALDRQIREGLQIA